VPWTWTWTRTRAHAGPRRMARSETSWQEALHAGTAGIPPNQQHREHVMMPAGAAGVHWQGVVWHGKRCGLSLSRSSPSSELSPPRACLTLPTTHVPRRRHPCPECPSETRRTGFQSLSWSPFCSGPLACCETLTLDLVSQRTIFLFHPCCFAAQAQLPAVSSSRALLLREIAPLGWPLPA
jgi:hypothetical protein